MRYIPCFIVFLIIFTAFTAAGESLPDYEPYEEEEFPRWALDLRRAEVIFFGTLPFTFFTSTLSYDLYRYAVNDFDSNMVPALFGNTTPPVLTNDEKLQIILVSVSLSAILSVLDYLLGEPWHD